MQSLKVGVTGGIGSGKSLICKIFKLLGVPVFDADSEAKRLMVADAGLVRAIRERFGERAYHDSGSLNTGYLAATVFSDPGRLKELNALVHPVVIQAGEDWAAIQDAPYSIKEAALLFESGSFKLNDYNILVKAPETIRVARVVARDGVPAEQVKARMERQWPDERKALLADFVIENDGVSPVIRQVLAYDRLFRAQRSQ